MVAIKRNSERESRLGQESRLKHGHLIGFARQKDKAFVGPSAWVPFWRRGELLLLVILSYMPRFVEPTISLARVCLRYTEAADTATESSEMLTFHFGIDTYHLAGAKTTSLTASTDFTMS
jgi:hypothetical protein